MWHGAIASRLTGAVAVLAFAALIAACGGADATPQATPSSTEVIPPATPTEEVAQATAPEPSATANATAVRCLDPYLSGAPYTPRAGQPIRLQPVGSPPPLARYQPMQATADPALTDLIRRTVGKDGGHFAIVVKNLADGRGVSLDAGRVFYAASLFKTWVMVEAFHQREAGLLDLGEEYIVSDYYKGLGLNPGELEACATYSVEYAMSRMMRVSDNVAANMVLDRVGVANTNAALRGLGLQVSGVAGGSLPTTAGGMADLLEAIAQQQAVSPESSRQMLELLKSEAIADRLPALLPPGTVIAHKTGNWEKATHDAGIVFSPKATYVIVVLTDYGFQDNGAAAIARLSRAVFDYYNPP